MSEFDLDRFWSAEAAEHLDVAKRTFSSLADTFGQWLDVCEGSIRKGGKILFFGNGGSAADCQHLATELTARYITDRAAIAAIALTTDTSALTAIGNDMGFDKLFSRQVEALGREGDIAVGISTSGNSKNVLEGLKTARKLGLITVGLGGRDGGKMQDVCDILLVVPSNTTARIQEMHITLGQMLCGALEQRLELV
ncbi:MAG TPA: D-sedoheptulose 7-phosphate isomerase [Patescibacteria group bacterium]|jgi:D-sedoheptulose 7-phosphate isomerase|nr:D-sedoheptulose 7-phosphate isomerase [Patescibacteria group bacterium]